MKHLRKSCEIIQQCVIERQSELERKRDRESEREREKARERERKNVCVCVRERERERLRAIFVITFYSNFFLCEKNVLGVASRRSS